jgi:hypothetical protein
MQGVGFKDPSLDKFRDIIDEGIDKMVEEDSRVQKVKVTSGLRGTKYFVEFPIISKNFDAYSLL